MLISFQTIRKSKTLYFVCKIISIIFLYSANIFGYAFKTNKTNWNLADNIEKHSLEWYDILLYDMVIYHQQRYFVKDQTKLMFAKNRR
jgi:hypothetical protein